MSKLLIGWAEESLVPDKKVSLAGQFYERISDYVESDISATAMAVEADGDAMIMVSVDISSMALSLVEYARKKFAALTDEVDPRKIIVCATHSHTSLKVSAEVSVSGEKLGRSPTVKILEEFCQRVKCIHQR